jgi:predicted secreted hydrolase
LWLACLPAFALPAMRLEFPRDHGAHPDLRTEWWYITGHARGGEREFGFQVTFFRTRVDVAQPLKSRFAAKQLEFAHAALTDVQGRKLLHDQRIAREGFDVALAAPGDARVRLRDWSLERRPDGWHARLPSSDFTLDLHFVPSQPVLLQGRDGLSRKGPEAGQASYYYSLPQLEVRGAIGLRAQRFEVTGKAWLDHEWSEAFMLAANDIFYISALLFLTLIPLVWLSHPLQAPGGAGGEAAAGAH